MMYRGRFAPSPTGPLHVGSLVAALASALDADRARGEWLVRMEDVDAPRTVAGAADDILRTLEAYGFEWHGPVVYQGERSAQYARAIAYLEEAGVIYPCICSRREIADSLARLARTAPAGELIYPGTCRHGMAGTSRSYALRVRVGATRVEFIDALQGRVVQDLEREVGDFVVQRADGVFAYQLAVVVDDADQGITNVVRGADLLASTPRQIFLQRLLGFATPEYLHLPIVVNARGEKLSKQTLAAPLQRESAAAMLVAALRFLGQSPPASLERAAVRDVWQWARANWSRARLPRVHGAQWPDRSRSG